MRRLKYVVKDIEGRPMHYSYTKKQAEKFAKDKKGNVFKIEVDQNGL